MEMAPPQIGRALVVVVDDRVSHGEREDTTGPLVTELLEEARLVVDAVVVVPGDTVAIRNALNTAVIGGVDLVITVGGTGVSPRDVTADATAGVLDRPIPGIAEAIRASGLAAGAVDAGLSRGLVGVSGSTLVVNLASSRAAVRDGMATLTPLVAHVIAELSGLDPVWAVPADGDGVPERVRRRLDEIFGDALPEVTRDERPDAPEPGDEWLRANRPPHHDPATDDGA